MREQTGRLAARGILPVEMPGLALFAIFARDGFAVLVEQRGQRFVRMGAPGILTEQGLGMLIWRGEAPWVVSKGSQREATAAEVAALRQFTADVTASLQPVQ